MATPENEASTHAENESLLGVVIGGQYEVLRVLGRGSIGTVYAARAQDGKEYALKVVRADHQSADGHDAASRFVRATRAAQGIESPYVARIADAGEDEARGLLYSAMELLSGRDLGSVIADLGPLDPGAIVPLFVQACGGLAAAHALGIVHRDVKPSNIFLHETSRGTLVAKLCDFEVAKQIGLLENGTALTLKGGVGSPMYMSPELTVSSKNVDHRSDLWSLGISLYEALTAKQPWDGQKGVGQISVAICTEDVQPVLELAPWVDPKLVEVVKKALARNPDDRFASAEELAAALRPHATLKKVTTEALESGAEERRRISAAARAGSTREPPRERASGGGKWVAIGVAVAVVAAVAGVVASR